ncbi:MAG TPA: tetratricopeptide repeat protein [bacterium]|nr:tetratricopeptide repeat protein [bacterium]
MPQKTPLSLSADAQDTAWRRRLMLWGQWLLVAALLTLPLVFCTRTQDQFELPKQLLLRALSSLLLGGLLALALADKELRWRRTPLDWPVLAWSLWLIVDTVHSVSPAVSWRGEYENFAGSLTQLNYSALFFLTVQFIHRPDKAFTAAKALLAAALGSALYALMQALQRDWVGWSASTVVADRFFGSLGNPNFLGGLMAMAIPLKLAMDLEAVRREKPADTEAPWRWLVAGALVLTYVFQGRADLLDPFVAHAGASASSAAVLCLWLASLAAAPLLSRAGRPRTAFCLAQAADLLVFFQALANTATRGAFLGLMVGLAVLALGWLALRPAGPQSLLHPGRPALRAAAGLGLLSLALVAALTGLGPAFRQRTLASLKDPGGALEVSRLEIWVPALKIWKANPIAGTGVDTFKTVFPSYSLSRFAKYDGENVSSRMAHCEPLQVLSTEGAVGLLLWLWLCAAAFIAWWRVVKGNGEPSERVLLLGLGSLAAAYLAQNLVSFGMSAISAPFWICLGLLFFASPLPEPRIRGPKLGWGTALALGALLAAGGIWLDSRTLQADMDYAFGNELQEGLPTLDSAPLDELRGTVSLTLNGLDSWGPLSPDLDAEAALWRRSVADSEARLSQSAPTYDALPFYQRAAGSLMMVLAAAHLEEAVRLCPDEVKYEVYLGLCYEELFRRCDPERRTLWFQAAYNAYTRGCELNPGNAYYRGNLARLWSQAAQGGNRQFFEQAQAYYLQAVALAPVTRLFYENLMGMQASFADVADADALMDTVEARDKELAPVLLMEAAGTFFQWRDSNLSAWNAQAKAAAQAAELDWTARAVALDPTNASYALSLGVFYLQAGRRAEAGLWAHKALALDPGLDAAKNFIKENRL